MHELLIDELKNLCSAAKQIVRALPKLAKAASTPELQAFLGHLDETKGQILLLEKISELVVKKLTGKLCVGKKGVLEEGTDRFLHIGFQGCR